VKFANVQYVCGNDRSSALQVILSQFIYLVTQNHDVYMAAELPSKQIAKSMTYIFL